MDFSYLDDWVDEEAGPEIAETGEGYRNVWVAADASGGSLHPATLETMGQGRELADQIGVYVYGVLLGDGVEALGPTLFANGADKVLAVDQAILADYDPELYASALADLVERYRPEILLFPATAWGNDLGPRVAQRLDTGLVSHCTKLELDMSERLLLGAFPVLGGEVYHTVACPEARPQMATVQPGAFRVPYPDPHSSGDVEIVEVDLADDSARLEWIDLDATADTPALPLSKANIVVAAGRGMGDDEGFALVEQLAEALGGVVAGSRGAFDEGWIAEEQIVGVGGTFIAPDLYVSCGISGDIYHYFGVQDAKFVVALNADDKAPIMKAANMAVVGDAKRVIPAILEALAG